MLTEKTREIRYATRGCTLGYSGTGTFTQSGGTNTVLGSLVLGQGTSSVGTYNLNGGLLSLSGSGLLSGPGSATFNFNGGTFQAASSFATSVPIVLSMAGSNAVFDSEGNTLTLAGSLSGPGGFQKVGSGTLTLSASNGYTGITLISGGTLLLANTAAIAGSTFDTSGSGSLSFGTLTSATFGGLQGSGNLALDNANPAAVALSVGGNNSTTTFSGMISGSGSLTKTGSGDLILSGSNDYTGGTTVNDGTLYITDSHALSAGTSLTVVAGGVFIYDPSPAGLPAVASSLAAPRGVAIAAVPEPGTLALLSIAGILYLWSVAARAPGVAAGCPSPRSPKVVLAKLDCQNARN